MAKNVIFGPVILSMLKHYAKQPKKFAPRTMKALSDNYFLSKLAIFFFVVWQPLDFCERRVEVEMLFFTT